MFDSEKQLYLCSPSGELTLVEIYENAGVVTIMLGDRRMDLKKDSAFDFADALLSVASEAAFCKMDDK